MYYQYLKCIKIRHLHSQFKLKFKMTENEIAILSVVQKTDSILKQSQVSMSKIS